jgi:acetoin utilization deacetylase AcuC-like enzyme
LYDNPNVLFISLHNFWNGNFYPGGPDGYCTRIGAGAGLGYNINIPWNLVKDADKKTI